jgi:hypothetical protein
MQQSRRIIFKHVEKYCVQTALLTDCVFGPYAASETFVDLRCISDEQKDASFEQFPLNRDRSIQLWKEHASHGSGQGCQLNGGAW